MRLAAALLPESTPAEEKAPCQMKKPIAKAGKAHSKMILQEDFIGDGLYRFGDTIQSVGDRAVADGWI
jgi:hypothetical protein